MRLSSLCIISLLSVGLAGCQTTQQTKVARSSDLPQQQEGAAVVTSSMTGAEQQSILSLGRGMSEGSVDIYEPGASKLDVPEMEAFNPRVSPVPENPNLIVRDPSVTVYSLDSTEPVSGYPSPLTPMPEDAVAAPAPVAQAAAPRYAADLTPTDEKGTVR